MLVAGLLLVGMVAESDGLFDAAARRLAAVSRSPVALLAASLALVAVVTAILNLDTAAVFLTPVLIKTARNRGLDSTPFLYGCVFMVNASSLFLPGSNLTNLLVLHGRHSSGASFAGHLFAPALAASMVTAVGVIVLHRRSLLAGASTASSSTGARPPGVWSDRAVAGSGQPPRAAGALAATSAAVAIVALHNAALPVLGIGLVALAWRARRREMEVGKSLRALGLPSLVGLFLLAVALGTVARASSFPADQLRSAGTATTAVVAALGSVLVNNLPAAALLSATPHVHADALLLGLDIGPNLAVTGSLAVLLWWRAATAAGERPSAAAYSRQGLLLAPLALAAAVLVAGR